MKGGELESITLGEHAAIIDREETKWSTVIHGAGITLGEQELLKTVWRRRA